MPELTPHIAHFAAERPLRYWMGRRADGQKALVFEMADGRLIAFEVTSEFLAKLSADLAQFSQDPPAPEKPNG